MLDSGRKIYYNVKGKVCDKWAQYMTLKRKN